MPDAQNFRFVVVIINVLLWPHACLLHWCCGRRTLFMVTLGTHTGQEIKARHYLMMTTVLISWSCSLFSFSNTIAEVRMVCRRFTNRKPLSEMMVILLTSLSKLIVSVSLIETGPFQTVRPANTCYWIYFSAISTFRCRIAPRQWLTSKNSSPTLLLTTGRQLSCYRSSTYWPLWCLLDAVRLQTFYKVSNTNRTYRTTSAKTS